MDLPNDIHIVRDAGGVVVTLDSYPDEALTITRGRLDPANTREEAEQIIQAEIAAWLKDIGWQPDGPAAKPESAKSAAKPEVKPVEKAPEKSDAKADAKADASSTKKGGG